MESGLTEIRSPFEVLSMCSVLRLTSWVCQLIDKPKTLKYEYSLPKLREVFGPGSVAQGLTFPACIFQTGAQYRRPSKAAQRVSSMYSIWANHTGSSPQVWTGPLRRYGR